MASANGLAPKRQPAIELSRKHIRPTKLNVENKIYIIIPYSFELLLSCFKRHLLHCSSIIILPSAQGLFCHSSNERRCTHSPTILLNSSLEPFSRAISNHLHPLSLNSLKKISNICSRVI